MLIWIPYLSLLAAVLLIYWPRQVAGAAMKAMPGGYDNSDPRGQQEKLAGRGRRALSAHLNGVEAFPIFGIAVLAALQRGVDPLWLAILCVTFVVVRIVFVLAYLGDRGSLRSLMFTLGGLACLALLLLAVLGA